MEAKTAPAPKTKTGGDTVLKLPSSLTSKQDIVLAHRELSVFIDVTMESVLRHDNPVKYPGISEQLRAIARDNQVDLRDEHTSRQLLAQLEKLKDTAPSLHMSFPSEPPPEVLQRLVTWFRKEVNPHAIIQVGLQPTIAAGVMLRTPNHQFDFSLRQHLYRHRDQLVEVLKGLRDQGAKSGE